MFTSGIKRELYASTSTGSFIGTFPYTFMPISKSMMDLLTYIRHKLNFGGESQREDEPLGRRKHSPDPPPVAALSLCVRRTWASRVERRMNSSGLGVSPKWCQMGCAGPMETLTNLLKAQKGMLSFLGHQGKAGGKGLVVCGERSRRTGGPSPLCSLPPFMCHVQLFKPGCFVGLRPLIR